MNNRFYRIDRACKFVAFTRTYKPTGEWTTPGPFGPAQVLRAEVADVKAKPGDEVHDLIGGAFLIRDGRTVAELKREPRRRVEVPAGHAHEIADTFAADVKAYRPWLPRR